MYYKRPSRRLQRAHFLDEFRGLCVLLMIFYHGAYDVAYVFRADFPAFQSWAFRALQLFICCNFIFIAGISSRYSHNNIKRGLIVLGAAVFMSLCTYFLMREQLIVFGVLHLLGVCMILHGIIFWGMRGESRPFLCFFIFMCLFAATWGISGRYIGFFELYRIPLPSLLYNNYWLSPLGFMSADFFSADYFPLMPWVFLFFAGSFFGVYFKRGEMPDFFYRKHIPLLGDVGKHALVIYILHQPIIYGLLSLFFLSLKTLGV